MKTSSQAMMFWGVAVVTVFLALFAHMAWKSDWLEVGSFVTAVLGLYLLTKENAWGWPLALVSSGAYSWFFLIGNLKADASLNLVYAVLAVHGWWAWTRKTSTTGTLKVSRMSPKLWGIAALAFALGLAVYFPIVTLAKGSAPLIDSGLAVASYIAQFLQNRKILENWGLWIVINAGYIVLYAVIKPYYLTALLSLLLIAMSILGHVQWRKAMSQPTAPS